MEITNNELIQYEYVCLITRNVCINFDRALTIGIFFTCPVNDNELYKTNALCGLFINSVEQNIRNDERITHEKIMNTYLNVCNHNTEPHKADLLYLKIIRNGVKNGSLEARCKNQL